MNYALFSLASVLHARCATKARIQRHWRLCALAQCRIEGIRGRLSWPMLGRVAISSAPLAVFCEHVQMGEGSFGLVRQFLEQTPHADKG